MPLTGPLIFLLVPFSILLLPFLPIVGGLGLYALFTGQSLDGILGPLLFDPLLQSIMNFMQNLAPGAEWLDKLMGWFSQF